MGETSIDADRSFDHIGAINLGSDKYVPSLTLLAEEVHRYGAKISIEINHSGACAEPMLLVPKITKRDWHFTAPTS